MESQVTTTSAKGVIIALILMVLSLAAFFLDLEQNNYLTYIGYALFIGGIIWSVYIYGKQINYDGGFGKYFTHGFKVTALVTVIMIIFVVVLVIAFPEIKTKAIEAAGKAMDEQGKMSDEQKKQALTMTDKFFMAFTLGGTLLGYMFFGTLAALVGAAITKKQPRLFHD